MIKLDDKFTEDFSPQEQIVMLRLLFMADEDGIAEIATRNFAELCGLTRQQLRTTLTNLSRKGEVEIVVSKKTNQNTNPKGNPKSTFVFICKYESYKIVKKETTQSSNQSAITILQAKCKEREKTFENSLIPYVISRGGIYEPEMIRRFFNYWTEKNKSGTKMRFEMEKTWETQRRLITWNNNEKQFNRNGQRTNNNRASSADKAASRAALEGLADRILEQH